MFEKYMTICNMRRKFKNEKLKDKEIEYEFLDEKDGYIERKIKFSYHKRHMIGHSFNTFENL